MEAGRIVAFEPRGSGGEGVINGGVYLLRRDIVGQIGPGFQSLEQDVFPRTAAEGRLHGSIYEGDFIDIGVPAALDAAQRDIPRMRRRPAAFLDRDGVLNVDHGYIHESSRFEWIPGAKAAVKRLNDAGYYTIIVTNQAGVAHGHYEEPAIQALHAWINSELRSVGAHIDAFYYCPYHPEGLIKLTGAIQDRSRRPECCCARGANGRSTGSGAFSSATVRPTCRSRRPRACAAICSSGVTSPSSWRPVWCGNGRPSICAYPSNSLK